jgi:hypothetical protein
MPPPKEQKIVAALLEAFTSRRAVFSDTKELLENQIPEGVNRGSEEHANFLFYLISQDHGVRSAKLYERAKALYSSQPDAFRPKSVVRLYADEHAAGLVGILKTLAVRYPRNGAISWYRNSQRLCQHYSGDARRVFSSEDAREIMAAIRTFHGFGPKTGGLLFRVFVGTGIAAPRNLDDVDFPTDIHDTRIAALTGVADIPVDVTEATYAPYVKLAEAAWKRACHNEKANWLQVDRALWILGSKGCAVERHHDCPIRKYCVRGNDTLL